MMLDRKTAKVTERNYAGSYHRVWEDADGKTLLEARTRRYSSVSINFAALEKFREESGDYVGLASKDFMEVIPLSKLDDFKPVAGDNYIVVGKADLEPGAVAPPDETIPF